MTEQKITVELDQLELIEFMRTHLSLTKDMVEALSARDAISAAILTRLGETDTFLDGLYDHLV